MTDIHEKTSTSDETDYPRVTARAPGVSYQELLALDTHPVPDLLKIDKAEFQGDHQISVDRYISRDFHELEKKHLWPKVWQMACREEQIPNVGDNEVYEIVDTSILVVRSSEDEIKAFYNVCLHQGRLLREEPTANTELRCAFHGFCWNLDGSVKQVVSEWDHPQIDRTKFGLREVKTGTWGGFVFINMDPDCVPLEEFLGDLPQHFERWPLEDRYTSAHVAKLLACNWKVAQEAFMENLHVAQTHSQFLTTSGFENGQYDTFGNFVRGINIVGYPDSNLVVQPTDAEIAEAFGATPGGVTRDEAGGGDATATGIPEGMSVRAFAAAGARDALMKSVGEEVDELSDSEMIDVFFFTVFPNFHPWGAFNRIVYKFRPYGDNHEMCVMETYLLEPFTGERPPAAKTRWLGVDQSYLEAPELGELARIFYQDEYNLPKVQTGMHTLAKVQLGTNAPVYQFGNPALPQPVRSMARHSETITAGTILGTIPLAAPSGIVPRTVVRPDELDKFCHH